MREEKNMQKEEKNIQREEKNIQISNLNKKETTKVKRLAPQYFNGSKGTPQTTTIWY